MSVRIGFVGGGWIAREHLKRLAGLDKAELVAVCDIDAERAAEAASAVATAAPERPAVVTYQDHDRMLARERLDAVYVCLPPFAHGAPEAAALDAGAALFVEKPVSLDLRQANEVLVRARRCGAITGTGYQSRYNPEVDRLRREVLPESVAMVLAFRFGTAPGAAWFGRHDLSGGHVTEMVTHQLDLLRFTVGEVHTVYGAGALRGDPALRPEGFDIDDVSAATLTFASGAIGVLAANLVAHDRKPETARGIHYFCRGVRVSILGQEGEDRQFEYARGDDVEVVTSTDDALLLEDAAFIDAVSAGNPRGIRSDYANGIRTLAVSQAHDLSVERGQPIVVADLLAERAPAALRES